MEVGQKVVFVRDVKGAEVGKHGTVIGVSEDVVVVGCRLHEHLALVFDKGLRGVFFRSTQPRDALVTNTPGMCKRKFPFLIRVLGTLLLGACSDSNPIARTRIQAPDDRRRRESWWITI